MFCLIGTLHGESDAPAEIRYALEGKQEMSGGDEVTVLSCVTRFLCFHSDSASDPPLQSGRVPVHIGSCGPAAHLSA